MSRKLPDSMHWQIYQAYLRGPQALFRLFEDAFGRLALYGEPEPDQRQREIKALSDEIARLKAQVERLQAEVSELLGRNFRLGRRNAELESLNGKRLAQLQPPTFVGSSGGEANPEPAPSIWQKAGWAAWTSGSYPTTDGASLARDPLSSAALPQMPVILVSGASAPS